jgi:hypothetical protein
MIAGKNIESFLATVVKVLVDPKDFEDLEKDADYVLLYNSNKSFFQDENGKEKNTSYLGAIVWNTDYSIKKPNYAFPFDKNNLTYPIAGETVIILCVNNGYYYLPFSQTQYPNYRQDYITYRKSKLSDVTDIGDTATSSDYKETKETGIVKKNTPKQENPAANDTYSVSEKIKYLKPYTGDTILSGRLGNTIRLTQNYKNSDKSPAIIIRNGQSENTTNQPIGFLAEEDINNDGSSVWFSSGDINVPLDFSKITKERTAWKEFPESNDLKGHQLYVASNRIVLCAKSEEFVILSKGNSGFITDGNFTVDTKKSVFVSSDENIQYQSANDNYFLMSSVRGGKIYIGRAINQYSDLPTSPTKDDAIQQMVLGNMLVSILDEIITEILKQSFLTPAGPTKIGPENIAAFNNIKSKLNTILSQRLYLSKS